MKSVTLCFFFTLRRPPSLTRLISSAASDGYKRQQHVLLCSRCAPGFTQMCSGLPASTPLFTKPWSFSTSQSTSGTFVARHVTQYRCQSINLCVCTSVVLCPAAYNTYIHRSTTYALFIVQKSCRCSSLAGTSTLARPTGALIRAYQLPVVTAAAS